MMNVLCLVIGMIVGFMIGVVIGLSHEDDENDNEPLYKTTSRFD